MQGITGAEWFDALQKAMDLLVVQNRVAAGNIANVNTPGYSNLQLNFRQELERLLQSGSSPEAATPRPVPGGIEFAAVPEEDIQPAADTASPRRQDGNNVVLEKEMATLAESNEVYTALARIATKNFKMARYVITGGR